VPPNPYAGEAPTGASPKLKSSAGKLASPAGGKKLAATTGGKLASPAGGKKLAATTGGKLASPTGGTLASPAEGTLAATTGGKLGKLVARRDVGAKASGTSLVALSAEPGSVLVRSSSKPKAPSQHTL